MPIVLFLDFDFSGSTDRTSRLSAIFTNAV
jgi:hypothetical protein